MKTIKAIHTNRYSIELSESVDNKYIIIYGPKNATVLKSSENIKDLNIASRLFDIKLAELEGN